MGNKSFSMKLLFKKKKRLLMPFQASLTKVFLGDDRFLIIVIPCWPRGFLLFSWCHRSVISPTITCTALLHWFLWLKHFQLVMYRPSGGKIQRAPCQDQNCYWYAENSLWGHLRSGFSLGQFSLFIKRQITTNVISRHFNYAVQFKPIIVQFTVITIQSNQIHLIKFKIS